MINKMCRNEWVCMGMKIVPNVTYTRGNGYQGNLSYTSRKGSRGTKPIGSVPRLRGGNHYFN